MKYTIKEDIKIALTLLNISIQDLANYLNVSRFTIYRIINEQVNPSNLFIESFYSFLYENPIRRIDINNLKIQFALDNYESILFHGAKDEITDPIDLTHSRKNIDFGEGFYLGTSYEQASSYVFPNEKSSVYLFDARKLVNLKIKEFDVNEEWMLLISYFRGQLEKYKDSLILKSLVKSIKDYDVIIAPIADNNMYDIMNRFTLGNITDKQAISALSASSLGKQYVLKTEKAIDSIQMIDRLYLSNKERTEIREKRRNDTLTMLDKAKLSIEKYRREGKYIDEVLK